MSTVNTPKRVSFGSTHGSMVETLIIDDMMPADEKTFYQDTLLQRNNNNQQTLMSSIVDKSVDHTHHAAAPKQQSHTEVHHSAAEAHVSFASSHTEHVTVLDSTSSSSPDHADMVATVEAPPNCDTHPNLSSTLHSTSTMSSSNVKVPNSEAKPGPPIIRLHRSPSTISHDNPFTAEGELSQKAEYILRHSTISRTEIRISDPDLSRSNIKEDEIIQKTEGDLQSSAPNKPDGGRPNEINVKENGKAEEPLTPQSVQVEVGTANTTQPEPQQAEEVKLKEPKCKCCVVM